MLIASRIIGRRWFAGYMLAGLIFGVYNEFCFEYSWDYSPVLGLMIWRDVPLIVVLGWGIDGALILTITNRIMKWRHWTKVWVTHLLDVALFCAFGSINEFSMSSMHFWKYNFTLHEIPLITILGYFSIGVFLSATGRTFQTLLDSKGEG